MKNQCVDIVVGPVWPDYEIKIAQICFKLPKIAVKIKRVFFQIAKKLPNIWATLIREYATKKFQE